MHTLLNTPELRRPSTSTRIKGGGSERNGALFCCSEVIGAGHSAFGGQLSFPRTALRESEPALLGLIQSESCFLARPSGKIRNPRRLPRQFIDSLYSAMAPPHTHPHAHTPERPAWSDEFGLKELKQFYFFLPNSNWSWENEWEIEVSHSTDENGWQYTADFSTFYRSAKPFTYLRRRKWFRKCYSTSENV